MPDPCFSKGLARETSKLGPTVFIHYQQLTTDSKACYVR